MCRGLTATTTTTTSTHRYTSQSVGLPMEEEKIKKPEETIQGCTLRENPRGEYSSAVKREDYERVISEKVFGILPALEPS